VGELAKRYMHMASRGFWVGWVFFAGVLMVVIGILNFGQGLIAIIRDDYYVLTLQQIIIFTVTAWVRSC
jgi:hypothetical protein